jgi:N-ethylmaleimide reductase
MTFTLDPEFAQAIAPMADTRTADIDAGIADIITVGTMALANPHLPARQQAGAVLDQADPTTFYGGDHHGYTDYPTLDQPTDESSNR